MRRLIWSPTALAGVRRVRRFLAQHDESTAQRAVRAIQAGVRLLLKRPSLGRPAPELGTGCREWPIPFGHNGYLVLYRVHAQDVVILAVRHQKESDY